MVGKNMSYHQADTNVYYMVPYAVRAQMGWDRDINDFVTTTQVQVTDNTFQCCATVKQFQIGTQAMIPPRKTNFL